VPLVSVLTNLHYAFCVFEELKVLIFEWLRLEPISEPYIVHFSWNSRFEIGHYNRLSMVYFHLCLDLKLSILLGYSWIEATKDNCIQWVHPLASRGRFFDCSLDNISKKIQMPIPDTLAASQTIFFRYFNSDVPADSSNNFIDVFLNWVNSPPNLVQELSSVVVTREVLECGEPK